MANVYKYEQLMEWLSSHTIADVLQLTSAGKREYSEDILHIEKTKTDADIDITNANRFNEVYAITDIDWDTDQDDEDPEVHLPADVDIMLSDLMENSPWVDADDDEDVQDAIVDYLSDKYGYCIFSCSIKRKEMEA